METSTKRVPTINNYHSDTKYNPFAVYPLNLFIIHKVEPLMLCDATGTARGRLARTPVDAKVHAGRGLSQTLSLIERSLVELKL